MNMALPQQKAPSRWSRGTLYGMLLLAVLVSLPLGILIAAMGAWFAIQSGSLLYLPVGLAILLAALAIVRSHSIPDLVLLVVMVLAMTGWLVSESDFRHRIINGLVELSGRTDLLLGMLATMLVVLLLVQRRKFVSDSPGAFVR